MSIGGGIITHARAKESVVRIVVHRANGTVEDLGVVAYWHRNPLKRWAWSISQFFRKLRK